jgi:glutaminyl-peptide cyclotransferase
MALSIALLAVAAYLVVRPGARTFDGERAMEHVRALVEIGPRLPNTPGSQRARAYIAQVLDAAGVEVWEEEFVARVAELDPTTGERRKQTFHNVLGRLRGGGSRTLAWGAHYDTLDLEGTRFTGANDAASAVGVVLELARHLAARRDTLRMTHLFLFFDGEEAIGTTEFRPYTVDPSPTACFGSGYQARKWKRENTLPAALVLLDMVGDRDLDILWESGYSDLKLRGIFARAARQSGLSSYFFTYSKAIIDDHVPFQARGVPAIDLIDFRYGEPNDKGGSFWHTPEDTIDKLSAESLEIVGEVCLQAIPLLEKTFED